MENNFAKLRFDYRFYLLIGVLGSIVIGAGEYLLHYSPKGPTGEISMLLDVPLPRARIGHFLAIAGIPFYFAGYYGLLKLFKSSHEIFAKCLFILGILSFTIGGVWISSRYFAAVVLQQTRNTSSYNYFLSQYSENYQVLVWALRILVALLSVFYILSIMKNKVGVPKWLAIFNPLVILALTISSLFWFMPLGVHIAPIAMNVTHLTFFVLLLYYTSQRAQRR